MKAAQLVVESVVPLPFYGSPVSAGFPSPADDYIENNIDLNSLLIRHPVATFFLRVTGDSMLGANINSGDVLIVDRAVRPQENHIVIAAVNGELTVKRLVFARNPGSAVATMLLVAENPQYAPIPIVEGTDCYVGGVVRYVIHPV